MNTCSIIFPNGTTIRADRNGTCFITDTKPDFPEDLSIVSVVSDEQNEYYSDITFHNAYIIEPWGNDRNYRFAFLEYTPEELYQRALDEERIMNLDLISDILYNQCLMDLGIN